MEQNQYELRSEVLVIQEKAPFSGSKAFPSWVVKIRDNERIRCPGSSGVSIAVTGSDLLNTTLISPGNP